VISAAENATSMPRVARGRHRAGAGIYHDTMIVTLVL
jgi:hypothetical protein